LFDPVTFNLTLAVFLHPAQAKYYTKEEQEELNRRSADRKGYQQRREETPLYYVNFPATPFAPPRDSSVLLYQLRYGHNYHMQYIQRIIAQQWVNQFIAYRRINETSEKPIPMAECLPDSSPICSGRITCSLNMRHEPEFYFHGPVDIFPPPKQELPTHVIGVCAYDGIYAYAVLDLDGRVVHVDDVHVPRHVDPARGARRYSDNFVHEVANGIVSNAWHWQAYVGIEDTALRKSRASISRAVNQSLFGMPTQRIIKVISQKMLREGMMEPRLVNPVSRLDCSHCKKRIKPGRQKYIHVQWTADCPECRYRQAVDIDTPSVICVHCGCEWVSDEGKLTVDEYLSCPLCYTAPILVRQNMAVVVAQKTLIGVVRHYNNLVAKLELIATEQLLERERGGL
jgi:DNA-directed RNA polymerase subunit RPC12/RpoP